MKDENQNERVLAVVESLNEAFADWLPVDATQREAFDIIGMFALERCVCVANSPDEAVALVAEMARVLGEIATSRAHEVHEVFAEVVRAAAEDSIALPEGEDR